MRPRRPSDRRRLLAVTVALGMLTTVAASTFAAAEEPAVPRSEAPTEADVDGTVQAPVDWTTDSTATTEAPPTEPAGEPAEEPADDSDTATPGGALPPAPPSTEATETGGDPVAEPPEDTGTPTTASDAPTSHVALEPPAPVVDAANPFA